MTLEDFLKPVKWIDEQVLRQYTKLGKKFDLVEGRKKYFVGFGLDWIWTGVFITNIYKSFGELMIFPWGILTVPDYLLNGLGIMNGGKEDITSGARALDPSFQPPLYVAFNRAVRPFVFLTGAGFVGKCGIDVLNSLMQGKPIEADSFNYLQYGIGFLSLASSMYLKDTDPKLLEKEPFWKKGYNWLKESLVPQPLPQPVPVKAYPTLEECI